MQKKRVVVALAALLVPAEVDTQAKPEKLDKSINRRNPRQTAAI